MQRDLFGLAYFIFIAIVLVGLWLIINNSLEKTGPIFNESERIIVFAAHPDDEVIGAATIISRAIKNGSDVFVVIATDGAPKEFGHGDLESETRKNETRKAMSLIGVNEENIIFLDYDDLGFIFEINLTKEIDKIAAILKEKDITQIFLHAYEGGHVDHDAVHYLVIEAVKKLQTSPQIYEFPEYNRFYWGNPIPDEYDTIDNEKYPILVLNLSQEEVELKKTVLKQYNSQRPSSQTTAIYIKTSNASMPSSEAAEGYKPYTEYELYREALYTERLATGMVPLATIPVSECTEDYLVCTYYWQDMIREVPLYNYMERPHPPMLAYELFFERLKINKNFTDFKQIVESLVI